VALVIFSTTNTPLFCLPSYFKPLDASVVFDVPHLSITLGMDIKSIPNDSLHPPSVQLHDQTIPPTQLHANGFPPGQSSIGNSAPAMQFKWDLEDDNLLFVLRHKQKEKWDDIAKRFPGRSSTSCRLRYHNYLTRWVSWDDETKDKFAFIFA